MYAMIQYDPDERICAHEALQHPYFRELRWADIPYSLTMNSAYIYSLKLSSWSDVKVVHLTIRSSAFKLISIVIQGLGESHRILFNSV